MNTYIIIQTNIFKPLFILMVACGLIFVACEGPEGPAGADGEQGPAGPAGPAGEDGSVIFSGDVAPEASTGNNGDYYINLSTGELYGPKDSSNGWGTPISLSGEDGADGQNGNTILNGQGNPTQQIGSLGDYYIDTDTYNLWGPKGEAAQFNNGGWGLLPAINLQASANATLYVFDGFDFTTGSIYNFLIDVTQQELKESSWNVYLVEGGATGTAYHVPGYGPFGNTDYRVFQQIISGSMQTDIRKVSGPGELFNEVRVVRVKVSNVVDNKSKISAHSSYGIDDINFDNYDEVARYFGLNH